jgi:phosphoheptose isomerase
MDEIMTNKLLKGAVLFGTVATVGLLSTAPASALTFGFQNIFPASLAEQNGDGFAGDFFVDVSSNGSNTVLFKFLNQAQPITATRFIGDVYFDQSNSSPVLSNITHNVNNLGTVNFSSHNGSFPQGNQISFNEDFKSKFTDNASNGVQTGEVLGISFDGNYNNVISAIQDGSLRIGIHAQAIDGDDSDSYYNKTTSVPTPALLPGLIAIGAGVLRKRKAEQATVTEAEV